MFQRHHGRTRAPSQRRRISLWHNRLSLGDEHGSAATPDRLARRGCRRVPDHLPAVNIRAQGVVMIHPAAPVEDRHGRGDIPHPARRLVDREEVVSPQSPLARPRGAGRHEDLPRPGPAPARLRASVLSVPDGVDRRSMPWPARIPKREGFGRGLIGQTWHASAFCAVVALSMQRCRCDTEAIRLQSWPRQRLKGWYLALAMLDGCLAQCILHLCVTRALVRKQGLCGACEGEDVSVSIGRDGTSSHFRGTVWPRCTSLSPQRASRLWASR